MTPFRLRTAAPALALLALAACGSPPETAAAEAAPPQQPQPPSTDVPAPAAPSPAPAASAAPAGYYECYFYGDYGLQNGSMTSLRIHGPAEYEAMEERGRYAEADGTLRMESGPLAGRVAHLRESDGRPALVFVRKENEVDGRPTLDISDTWCYFEPR